MNKPRLILIKIERKENHIDRYIHTYIHTCIYRVEAFNEIVFIVGNGISMPISNPERRCLRFISRLCS